MNNITFSKRFWWSIARPNKYRDMTKLGFKKAIKYLARLSAIMALVIGIVGAYVQAVQIQKIEQYINENIPQFKIENKAKQGEEENYKLSIENNDVIILDNTEFLKVFDSVIVVNTNMKSSEAITEYFELVTQNNNCIILLEEECIVISTEYNPDSENSEEGTTKYTYSELLNKYISPEVKEFDKNSLLTFLNNMSFINYILVYFSSYFIILLGVFGWDILILGCIAIIISMILKKDISKKELFSLAIYSLTLPMILYIIYLIINYFMTFNIKYVDIIELLIPSIYIIYYFYKDNKIETL